MAGTRRVVAIRQALRDLAPLLPLADFETVFARASGSVRLRPLTARVAAWLALVSHARHAHTDYDALLADGYDRDAARHFVLDETQAALELWGCRRVIDAAPETESDQGRA